MRIKELVYDVEIPEDVEISLAPDGTITVKGKKGELKRVFRAIGVTIAKEEKHIIFRAADATKKEKAMLGTFRAHLRNMIRGVLEGHQYKLKICSGHFPMNVTVKGNELSVKNFLGEKVPRVTPLIEGVAVKVEGNDVTVECPDLEKAGIVASRIEQLMFISRRDRRVFQDGIFITQKPGMEKIA